MNRNFINQFSLLVFCLFLTACGGATESAQQNSTVAPANQAAQIAPEQTKQANPAEAVRVSAQKVAVKTGQTTEAAIKLNVAAPFHVNSNPASEKNLIPTEITFSENNGISVGKPVYPKGEMKTFQFSPDKPLSVYEGEVEIKIPIRAAANAPTGNHVLKGKLRIQPCDDEVCYRPQTLDISLPVTVN